jgi:hypothetical protein
LIGYGEDTPQREGRRRMARQTALPERPAVGGGPVVAPRRASRVSQRTYSVALGVLAGAALVGLIALGSRGFHWFDAALIGYAVGAVFSFAAVTYKYTFWLARPQTGRYFWRSWRLFFFYANFRRYTTLIPGAIFSGLLAQLFIRQRGTYRWITHLCIFWGVVAACAITFPLTFGWLRFVQAPGRFYQMWVFGFSVLSFDPASPFGFVIIHALDFAAVLLLIGLVLAFQRRFHDRAQIAIQRFRFDIMPLALLAAIAVTGLALTADSAFFGGTYYWYISLTHEAVVVLWLISLPFGKFFHIIERPATVGIELYWRTGADSEQRLCPRCGEPFAPARFITDLKRTTYDIGQDYAITRGPPEDLSGADPSAARTAATAPTWWQDFCPACKRVMRGEANLAALGRDGNRFL